MISNSQSVKAKSKKLRFASCVIGLLMVSACQKDAPVVAKANSHAELKTVELEKVEAATTTAAIQANGVLEAHSEIKLSFKTGGLIKRIAVDAGERVKANQLLAELDLTELNAGTQAMRENVRKAERDFARAQQLFADDVIAKSQLDDTRTALDVARASLRGMAFNSEVGRLVASHDGVVLRRFAESAEVVAPGQPVLTLAQDNGSKIFKVALSDKDALSVQIGDPAVVRFGALPNNSFAARVRTRAGGANPLTGLFDVELALDENVALEHLASGLIGRATIMLSESVVPLSSALMEIPVSAIAQANGNQASVYVFEPEPSREGVRVGSVKLVTIQINSPDLALGKSKVIVSDGVSIGQELVTRGASTLEIGERVRETRAMADTVAATERAP
jgi:membrane fusion protein, multidrug efflux system